MSNKTRQAKQAEADKVIGAVTTYIGNAWTWAKGKKVCIVAVHKNHHKPGADIDNDAECPLISDDDELRRRGGVTVHDMIEFQPFIEKEGCFSWVTSDARPDELEMFKGLRK